MREDRKRRNLMMKTAKITGGFWKEKQQKAAFHVLYEQYDILNGKRDGLRPEQYSFGIENFKIAAGMSDAEYHGYVYSDSEVGKWIEAASYSLSNYGDAVMEEKIDSLVDLIEQAQMEDGYLNTYFQVLRPEDRLKHFAFSCELYNMGHLMEAAAAYFEATGKQKFLNVMRRTADLLCEIVRKREYRYVYDGHAEIEIGLYRLYETTGEKKYLELSLHFINERGRQPCFFQQEELLGDNDTGANDQWFGADHHQAHMPVRNQRTAEGHAVKLVYLYASIADMVKEGMDRDGSLEAAMNHVWKNMIGKRMYITGGIGSQGYAERFTKDYDLPGDRGYLETCAAIGLVFWAKGMNDLYHDAGYMDVAERAIFNGVLAGWSLDGNEYFYTNTLHYRRGITDYREDTKHLDGERQKWFRCACCPSNILRLIASIQNYMISVQDHCIYCNLYGSGQWQIDTGGKSIDIEIQTDYPYSGEICITVYSPEGPNDLCIALRIPAWCGKYQVCDGEGRELCQDTELKDGYYMVNGVRSETKIQLTLEMPVRYVFANHSVWEYSGKAALMRGPLVYCLESVDNDDNLNGIFWNIKEKFDCMEGVGKLAGLPVLKGWAYRMYSDEKDNRLYFDRIPSMKEYMVTAIPYFAWQNRGKSDMDVWIPYAVSSQTYAEACKFT